MCPSYLNFPAPSTLLPPWKACDAHSVSSVKEKLLHKTEISEGKISALCFNGISHSSDIETAQNEVFLSRRSLTPFAFKENQGFVYMNN